MCPQCLHLHTPVKGLHTPGVAKSGTGAASTPPAANKVTKAAATAAATATTASTAAATSAATPAATPIIMPPSAHVGGGGSGGRRAPASEVGPAAILMLSLFGCLFVALVLVPLARTHAPRTFARGHALIETLLPERAATLLRTLLVVRSANGAPPEYDQVHNGAGRPRQQGAPVDPSWPWAEEARGELDSIDEGVTTEDAFESEAHLGSKHITYS